MFAWYCHVDKFLRTNIACLLWVARWPSLFTMHITHTAHYTEPRISEPGMEGTGWSCLLGQEFHMKLRYAKW